MAWFSLAKMALQAGGKIYANRQKAKVAMSDAQLLHAERQARGEEAYQGKLLEARQNDYKDEFVLVIISAPIIVLMWAVMSDDPAAMEKVKLFFEYFQSLDDVYGCPDCADGGAEFIEIIYDGVAKQVTFDAYTEIDGIQELTILLRDLRAEYWNQINENQECSIMPEVGPCDGICPTYYFNQNTNQCEEFITGCCGVEVFNTLEECQNICE